MKTLALIALLLPLLAPPATAADAAHPEVVELFTSQGCSSCPPANANLGVLAARPEILALSFGVTYWDQLGWKDTFASPAFTQRQWDYAHGLQHANVATPQVVVNGRADAVGNRLSDLEALLRKADRGPGGPELQWRDGRVRIAAGQAPAGGADVWLARYDPRVVQVPVARGENQGHTLPHRNVVRALTRIGHWSGQTLVASAAPAQNGLKTAVLVQAGAGGPIIAASRLD